ncbi:hypothetical protein KP509_24G028400 [Ceratopteris richardii]|nr:hypothetical protein KP509_24G028400 [Ceratopteris richardii]
MEAKPFLEDLGLKGRFVTWRAWQWAHATVSSRTLHVPWSNAGTLCPVGDLFNYAPPGAYQAEAIQKTSCCSISDLHAEDISPLEKNLSAHEVCELDACNTGGNLYFTDRLTDGGYDMNLKSYCFYARENYKKGDEVLLCYGLHTNLELLEHYGFLLPFNPNDKVYLGLDEFYGFACDKPQHGSMHIEVDGRPSFQLLAALRLCFVSKAVRQQKGHLALCGQQLSIENDVLVYQRLKERCLALLHEFPSTLHMDSVLEHILSLCSTFDGLIGLLELCGNIKSLSAESQKLLVGSVCGWTALHLQEREFILHELHNFSQHDSRGSGKSASIEDLGLKMERWWLSIRWRFCHKRILHRCVNHCARQLLLLE